MEGLLRVHGERVGREPRPAAVGARLLFPLPGQPSVVGGQRQQRLRELRRHRHRQHGHRQDHGHPARGQRRVHGGPVVVRQVERDGGVVVADARVRPGGRGDHLVPGDDRRVSRGAGERREQPGHGVGVLDGARGDMPRHGGAHPRAQALRPRAHPVDGATPDAAEQRDGDRRACPGVGRDAQVKRQAEPGVEELVQELLLLGLRLRQPFRPGQVPVLAGLEQVDRGVDRDGEVRVGDRRPVAGHEQGRRGRGDGVQRPHVPQATTGRAGVRTGSPAGSPRR